MTHSASKLSRTLSRTSGAAGSSLSALASRKGGLFGTLLAFGGGFLLFRILSNGRTSERLLSSPGVGREVYLSSSIVIDRSASDIYEFWRNFSNLPRIMGFLEEVQPMEGNVSHWVARLAASPALEWDSEVVEDIPGQRLSWRSLEGSQINTWGTVTFEPQADGRETVVSVTLNFNPPAAFIGSAAAHFLEGMELSVLSRNLQSLKTYMEMGEIPVSKHSSQTNPV